VLHHTYSTKGAFDAVEQFRREDGVICIWLYAVEDNDPLTKGLKVYVLEDILRPRIARLPDFWQNLTVKMLTRYWHRKYKKHGWLSREKWTIKDSEHTVRDRFTPLYAYLHTFKEVILWFQEKGLDYRLIDARAYEEKIGIRLTGIGIRGASEAYFDKMNRRQQQMTGAAEEKSIEQVGV
jgi:hypothetical protein